MIWLIIFIAFGVFVLIITEWRERHKAAAAIRQDSKPSHTPSPDPNCCGQHLVCERDNMLKAMEQPVYFDDEELDQLADIPSEELTEQQAEDIREVFQTLQPKEVMEWVRSLQMRRISLPADVREEALLIVREQRQHATD